MTTPTIDDDIAALSAAIDAGPTPGPWAAHFEEAYFVTGPDLGRVAMMMNLKGAHGLGGRRSGSESAANCRLIAAASPGRIARLIAALQEAREELSQPARVGLTEAQVLGLLGKAIDYPMACERAAFAKGIRAAERAHNIPAAQEGK